MYKVYSDGHLIHSDTLESLKISNPKVDLEVNKTGSFEFTVYPQHPHYNRIHKLKSIITVYQDDFLLFRGRVLNDEQGFYDEKMVYCEGDMAFLIDSIVRPYDYSGSISGFLQMLIDNHNSQVGEEKQFALGNVTVTDPNNTIARSDSEYTSTLDVVQKKLVEMLGGYIVIRHEEKAYIDYLQDFTKISTQKVEFAKNLLDLKRTMNGDEVVTALIPLGAKTGDDRLTVASVNNGLDYIYDAEAVEEYGWIWATQTWDDVKEASNLLKKAQSYLASVIRIPTTIELDAADLAFLEDGIESFHLGTYVRVTTKPHSIDQNFLVTKLSITLFQPESIKLTLGGVKQSFTSQASKVTFIKGNDGRDGEDAVVLRIDSSRGTVFKNSQITTTLTVAIYYGEKRITNKSELSEVFGAGAYLEWSWQRMDESAFGVISASDSRIKDNGFTFVLTPSDIDTKATFMCKLIV